MQPIDDLTNMVELILAIYPKAEIARNATILMDAASEQEFLMSLTNWYMQNRGFYARYPPIDQNLVIDTAHKFLRLNWDYIANSYTIAAAKFTTKEAYHEC